MTEETKELLPCPFCGEAADPKEVAYTHSDDDHKITHYSPGCTSCSATTKTKELWNSRFYFGQKESR